MNCVVICCDTFRYDMIGHSVVSTPNLDRLVREGIRFTNAYGEGLPTIQARRTMFTGVRSFPWRFEMGSRGLWPTIPGWHRIPEEQTTLAEMLLDKGVVTGLVGDTYHMFKPTQNFTRGFCSWSFIRGQETDTVRSGPLSAIDVGPHFPDGQNDLKRNPGLTQYLLNMLDRKTEEDYLTPRLFRRACTWLDENRENAPWMLWIDSFAPHELWDPPMEFADAYCAPGKSRNYIQPHVINRTDPSADEIERTRALYYGYVTFVDKWIGVFLAKLEQMGRLEDTAILFTSDHGTELWDQGRFGKSGGRLYAYNTRVPLLLRLPAGRDGGAAREDFAQHQDLLPTIGSLMGLKGDDMPDSDGRDLLDPSSSRPDPIIIGWEQNVSVRSHRWNLVLNHTDPSRGKKLFDLQTDPGETSDVAESHPDVASELVAHLEATLGPLPFAVKHHGDGRQVPPLATRIR